MGDLSRMAFNGSLLEADAIAGAGLTPSMDRLDRGIQAAELSRCDAVHFDVLFIRNLRVLLERCRDTLEAQGETLAMSQSPVVAAATDMWGIVQTIAKLVDQGVPSSMLLDENSPTLDAIRDVIFKVKGAS